MRTVREIRKELVKTCEEYTTIAGTINGMTPLSEDLPAGGEEVLENMKEDIRVLIKEMEAAYNAEKKT